MDPAVLEKVEKQRQALEINIANFRKSLRHWQNLELDYEGLREEFEILPEDTSKDECLRVAREFQPVVVDDKDLIALVKDAKTSSRTPRQLADLLSKRVDYVSRNADTIRKQITSEEKKLNALLLVENPETRDDAGLPLSEITEELDDDGNVISSKVERPEAGAAGLAEVLEKAGVNGLQSDVKTEEVEEPPSAKATVASSPRTSEAAPRIEELDDSDDESVGSDSDTKADLPFRVPVTGENPIPVHIRDTEEEARMRREMLEYGLDEVGAIVAELNLQEGESDISYDEDDDNLIMDSDFDDDEDDDLSEDEFGRVKKPIISEKYKKKMEDLEKRLGLTDLKNLGPNPDLPANVREALDRPSAAEAARKAAIAREEAASAASADEAPPSKKEKKAKKSVAFAPELDVAKELPLKRKVEDNPKKPAINPVGEAVIERSTTSHTSSSPPPAPPAPTPSKPASRFKAARRQADTTSTNPAPTKPTSTAKATSQPSPAIPSDTTPPADRPLISPLVHERPTPASSLPPNPDDIDEEMHRREIALEYHKLRNRRVHAAGGFVRDGNEEEDEEFEEMFGAGGQGPLMVEDERTGEVRRVSRFRLGRMG